MTMLMLKVDDMEAAAGGEPAAPRVQALSYAFRGPGDAHLVGQPCDVLDERRSECLVVFACGCRSEVTRPTLVPR
jgi:hypothetical protein